MELAFKTITSIDIITWAVGIYALKALTGTSLSRGNHNRGAGVNSSEHGAGAEVGMGSGGNSIKGDVRRRVVRVEDTNILYEGRFTKRQAILDKLKRDSADLIVRNTVQTCCRALRESRNVGIKQEASQVKADRFTTRTTVMGLTGK